MIIFSVPDSKLLLVVVEGIELVVGIRETLCTVLYEYRRRVRIVIFEGFQVTKAAVFINEGTLAITAATLCITILRHYIYRAFSAKTDKRPEFQNMIKDSGKKLFNVVIVWKLAKPEQRKTRIDVFLNAVYVFNDKIAISCNYKDSTKTINFSDMECALTQRASVPGSNLD